MPIQQSISWKQAADLKCQERILNPDDFVFHGVGLVKCLEKDEASKIASQSLLVTAF
jgi:hypothetical protein